MKDLDLIYVTARELPAGDRPAYLIKACGDDHALRARVEQMLAVADQADAFISELPGDTLTERDPNRYPLKTIKRDLADVPDEVIGQKIGRYKILERVGEGGCGVVYVAEQTEPVRRRVALKVIKLGMDTKQVVARFEAERQALAMMDHPNIAKVLDGGATDNGRPYFIMELVRGIKITDYCDQASLPTKDRLGLFVQVCHAIQHAHQKGIIHRDIKPSNILVTLNDGVPVPKVIDFGIAKATEGRLTEATVYTQLHQFIGTPAYMSPEQAEMSSLDIDTRSDIYSLGVLLYELLAGTTPFDPKELMASGIDAMRKAIREKEPVRPSTRLATLQGNELTTAAKRRAIEAPRLIHLLKGDLDWIVMKCLEKDRTRRYDTANGLASDLRRHLSNEPVVARPASAAYRFQKAIRRNKFAFGAAGALAATLLLGIVISGWQAARANREAARALRAEAVAEERLVEVGKERDAKELASQDAEAISKFLTQVFQSPDPAKNGRTITVAEALDNAAKKLESDPAVPPARRAKLEVTLASTYYGLGLFSNTLALSEKVRDYDIAIFGLENTNTIQATRRLATSYALLGRAAEALNLYEEVLPLDRKFLGPENDETLTTMSGLATCYDVLGRAEEALKLREEILALCRKALGPEHELTLKAMANLANSYFGLGRKDEALKLREEALALDRKALGLEQPETIETMNDLAISYSGIGRKDDAVKLQEDALAIDRKLFGPEHELTLTAMDALAKSYFDVGRKDEAVKLREEMLALDRKALGPEHPGTLATMNDLASSYFDLGRNDEALKLREEALALHRKALGPEHPDTIWAMNNLASSYSGVGRKDDAVKLSESALALALRRNSNSVESAEAYAQLGLRLDDAGRGDEAIKSFEQAVRFEPDNKDNQYWLGKALVDHQRYEEALPALRAAQKLLDPKDGRSQETDDRLALVETMPGGVDRFSASLRQTVADNPTNTLKAMQLATVCLWLGQTNERQTICRRLLNFAADSKDPTAHDRAAKACLIEPHPDPELVKLAVASGHQALALSATNDSARRWFLITAGLANVRDGKPAEAESLLTEALEQSDNSNQHGLGLAYRAIAYARLGRINEARADFSALEKLALPLPHRDSVSPALLDVDRLAVCIAYEEARSLLNAPSVTHP